MNKMKKFASIATAVLMTACMATPMTMSFTTSAATITINNEATGHTYEAYQIFKGTLSDGVLSNIDWGSGVDDTKTADLLTAINDIFGFENCTDAVSVAKVLSDAAKNATGSTKDMDITKEFADTVADYLASPTGTANKNTDGKYVIDGVADGYYLIQDKAGSLIDESSQPIDDAYTRYIVEVAGTTTVSPKSTKPSVVKKVYEESISTDNGYGAGYNDVADYDIGDAVPFKLYGSLPSSATEYAEYSAYFYQFNDTLGSEFTAPAVADIHVYYEQGTGDNVTKKEIVNALPSSLPDGKSESDYIVLEYSDLVRRVNGQNITITLENIKEVVESIDDNVGKITVEYSATLNSTAKVGYEGQVNAVNLEYSNNPNVEWRPTKGTEDKPGTPTAPGAGDGSETPETPGDKGKTPDDGVIVFTYGFDINKVISSTTTKLAGAKFAVYYMNGTNKVYIKTDADNKYAGNLEEAPTAETEVANANGVWESAKAGNIIIKGLDKDKTYYIEEIAAPAGYNKLAEAVPVTISSTFGNEAIYPKQNWNYSAVGNIQNGEMTALDSIKVNDGTNDINVTNDTGDDIGTVTIGNSAGSTLPGTGGIGTTLFYVGGGAMVAVAGVFLITKKRMGRKED